MSHGAINSEPKPAAGDLAQKRGRLAWEEVA